MKNQKVRKAIIPAAGLGTRFLPATKTSQPSNLSLKKPSNQVLKISWWLLVSQNVLSKTTLIQTSS